MPSLALLLKAAEKTRKTLGIKSDVERILQLPVEDLAAEGERLASKWTKELRRHDDAPPLRPIQGIIIETWSKYGAVAGNVGVGDGKTLAFSLLPVVSGHKNVLYLGPASVIKSTEMERWKWREHYHIPDATLVSYSKLSSPNAPTYLEELGPDLVLADEAQKLRHRSAARTQRFLRFMNANPDVDFVPLTGTLTNTTLMDYAHLLELALGDHSPLPYDQHALEKWCSVLDSGGEPDKAAWDSVRPLHRWAKTGHRFNVLGARKAFNYRFATTPGIVTTSKPSCDSALVLTAKYPPHNRELLSYHLSVLRDHYELPDGTELIDALHHARAAKQLAMGFYYVWDWPDGEVDEEWVDARSYWARSVRRYLKHHARAGVDSPFLVEQYVRKARRPPTLLKAALDVWDTQRHKPQPPVKAVWLDLLPVTSAVAWASERERGILWFSSRAVGEMIERFGISTMWEGEPDPRRDGVVALSIAVYHAGKNFQPWNDQLVLEPPTNAATWEQLLGRTHRTGQESPVVKADVFQHMWPIQRAMREAFKRAHYLEDTLGQPQRLNFADKHNFPAQTQEVYRRG